MIKLERLVDILHAAWSGVVCKEYVARISFARYSEWCGVFKAIEDIVSEGQVRFAGPILPHGGDPFFGNLSRSFGREVYTTRQALTHMVQSAGSNDWPLYAVDIHKAVFEFGKSGYELIGESSYPDGEIIPNASRFYLILIVT